MRYILTCMLVLGFWSLGMAQITRVEYFLDTDPGLGSATAVPFSSGTNIVINNIQVPLTNVSTGIHTLWVRTRSAQGRWSQSYRHVFLTTQVTSNQVLTAAEYFIDQEPGLGKGLPIVTPFPTNQQTISLGPITIDLTNVSTGIHALFVRTVNKDKNWSQSIRHIFLVKPGGGVTNITAFRYNFTTIGTAPTTTPTAIITPSAFNPAPSVNLNNLPISLTQLPDLSGVVEYDMNIWAISSDGLQSLVQTRRIRVTVLSNGEKAAETLSVKNYPNPFEQETTIEFELPVAQRVTITMWDMKGRKVATLAENKPFGLGKQQVVYNNAMLAAGTYTCQINSDKYHRAIKLIKH